MNGITTRSRPGAGSPRDPKTTELGAEIFPFDPDIAHVSARRAMTAPGDQLFDLYLRAFGHDFHGAVGAVSNPAVQSQPDRFSARGGAKKYSLHPAFYQQMSAAIFLGFCHHSSTTPLAKGYAICKHPGRPILTRILNPDRFRPLRRGPVSEERAGAEVFRALLCKPIPRMQEFP